MGIQRLGWLPGIVSLLVLGARPPAVSQAPSLEEASSAQQPASQLPSNDSTDWFAQGQQLTQAGRFAEAADALVLAVEGFAAEGHDLKQAIASSNLSWVYQQLGQWQKAQQAIETSLALLEKVPNPSPIVLAGTLDIQGQLQLSVGQPELALETWKRVADISATADNIPGTVASQINQAEALQALGLYGQARQILSEVASALQETEDSSLKAIGLQSVGNALRSRGHFSESEKVLQESLDIARRLSSASDISQALLNLGNTAYAQKNFEAALNFYQQAETASLTPELRVQSQLNQLRLSIVTGQPWIARALAIEIQAELSALTPSRKAVYARVNVAESLMELSADPKKVADILSIAIQQARHLQDSRAESYALGILGQLYEKQQQWSAARDLTEKALLFAQATNASEMSYRWQWQLGRLLDAQDRRAEAIVAYTEAVNTLSTLRSDLVTVAPDLQFSFRESVEPVYRELVGLLLKGDPSQKELEQARDTIESLQLAELDNFFREACLDAEPQQIDQIDPTAAAIYPIILSDRLATIVSIPGQPLRYDTIDADRSRTEDTFKRLREFINPAFPSEERLRLSQQIYDWLIRPHEATLAQSEVGTLVFVLDGALRNLPMSILHDRQQYLIERYSIAIAPGLQLLESKALPQEELQALALGLTEPRQGFSALPGVKFELERITSELPSQVLLDEAFTRIALEEAIDTVSAPIVHLATHGQFSSNPEETFLLTWDARIQVKDLDQLLQLRTQEAVSPIELLILSACQTATGDDRAALGLAGVAVRSGARTTLASLWLVNDQSTAVLMSQFYQELSQGVTRAEALRNAQLSLMKQPRYKSPYFWASFVLVGNWR